MNRTPDRKRLKIKHNTTPSGAWKDRFRKGCLDRLKNKRNGLINNLRGANDMSPQSSQELVSEIMKEEWEQMKLESPLLSSFPRQCGCSGSSNSFGFEDGEDIENIDEILNIFESIQQELLKEEQLLLAKYEDMMRFDDSYLCSTINLLSMESVFCPLCKRHDLLQNETVFFCPCGLRIDTQDHSLDLKFIHDQLKDSLNNHSLTCQHEPVFSLLDLSGANVQNLIMTCQHCDFMGIII